MDAITKRVQLKSIGPIEERPKVVDAHSQLMNSIISGTILRKPKVDDRPKISTCKADLIANALREAILVREKAIRYSSDEDESFDEDDWKGENDE